MSLVLFYVVALAAPNVFAAPQTQPATQPTPNNHIEKLIIMEPTQGRPRIIKPVESFYFMFRVDKLDVPKIEVSLVNSLCEQQRINLVAVAPPVAMQVNHWVMLLKAPELTEPGVYDLFIDLGIGYQRVPRAIRVVHDFKKRFRFVHLSNMNIGDPTAPDFDSLLVDEINLLNPEFIIATGDYIEGADRKADSESWKRIKTFFAKFNSPCYLLCGDQDDILGYPIHITPNQVSTLDYGVYHFFFMMDASSHPTERDTNQLRALITDLSTDRKTSATFLVGNRDNLGVLDGLKAMGKDPAAIFEQGKVRYLLFGGSTDWDFQEYTAKMAAAKLNNVSYIRTGQSSTSMKNGGKGFSQYRVFDINDLDVKYVYPQEREATGAQFSVPTGHLRIFQQGPNDGSQSSEHITVLNSLNQSFPDCRVVFRLAGSDPQSVKVANGKIERVFPAGENQLLVLATIGLPEKSAVQVLATTDPAIEAKHQRIPVQIDLNAPPKIKFKHAQTATGLKFLIADETFDLALTNTSSQPINVEPQVNLDGQSLIIQAAGQQNSETKSAPEENGFQIAPDKTVKLTVKPALRFIKPGRHLIQVYCLNDPLQRLTVFPIQIEVAGE